MSTNVNINGTPPRRLDNVQAAQIGNVRDDVRADGKFLKSKIVVSHAPAIARVLRGEDREVSAAYRCALEDKSGTYDGEAYDVIQRGIV